MPVSVQVRRVAMRCAWFGLRTYWFVFRPKVVGVKCVLLSDDDVLLVRHTYGRRGWDLPGGTVKRREVPIDAARREMHEELGRRIEDWEHLGVMFANGDHRRDNIHLFRTHLDDRQLDIDLMELAEADWFHPDRLPHDASPFVARILARAAMPSES